MHITEKVSSTRVYFIIIYLLSNVKLTPSVYFDKSVLQRGQSTGYRWKICYSPTQTIMGVFSEVSLWNHDLYKFDFSIILLSVKYWKHVISLSNKWSLIYQYFILSSLILLHEMIIIGLKIYWWWRGY